MTDRVQIITTCTSLKSAAAASPGSAVDSLPGLEAPANAPVTAERLYVGGQHRRLMAGVDELRTRHPVDVWIVSAKVGLVFGDDRMESYDDTFSGLSPRELRRRADALGIPCAFRDVAERNSALTLVLAGNEYFDAARLAEPVEWGSSAIALVSPSRAAEMPAHPSLRVCVVSQAAAKRWSLPLTLLKGEVARRLLLGIATESGAGSIGDRAQLLVRALLETDAELVAC
jgi:hypothetical protein